MGCANGIPAWVNILAVGFVIVLFYIATDKTLIKKMEDIQKRLAGKEVNKLLAGVVLAQVGSGETALGIVVILAIIFGLAYLFSR